MYPEEIIRYISGNYTEEDEEYVKKWIEKDPANRKELKRIKRVWETSGDLKLEYNVDQVWGKLSKKLQEEVESERFSNIGQKPTKKNSSKLNGIILRVAAVLMIIAGTYGFYQLTYHETQSNSAEKAHVYHTLISNEGEQVHFRFNDDSKVVLNGNSEIRYRSDFGNGTRNLHLKGEAYFEVNHDHPIPFIVYAGNMRVRDIGTKFNINAYAEGDFHEITVSEGEIEVTTTDQNSNIDSANAAQPVRITQGQKVEVSQTIGKMIISKANLHASLGWLNKRLIFDEEPFGRIVNRLERYYDIRIEVLDKELLSQKVTASFENERMENVLKVLSLSLKAKYNLNENKVEFYKKTKTNSLSN